MNSSADAKSLFFKMASAHKAGRLAHAYMIVGDSEDAAAFAEKILSMLHCSEPAPTGPCGNCRGCAQIIKRNHPALLWMEPHKRSRMITREQVLAAQDFFMLTAGPGVWKSVVFAEADRFNTLAANTILKILEEPPPLCLFLLLTNAPEAILQTIRSRCQTLILPRAGDVSADEWSAFALEALALPGVGALAAMSRARSVNDALKAYRDQIEKEAKSSLKEREKKEYLEGSHLEHASEIAESQVVARLRLAALGMLAALQKPCRDALVRMTCAVDEKDLPEQQSNPLAVGATVADILRNLRLIEEAKHRVSANMNSDWVFQRLFDEWIVMEKTI